MKDVHDMKDRDLDIAIAEGVMGQTVAAEEWPCFLYEDTSELIPQHNVILSRAFSYEPVLYRKDGDGLGTLVICPKYTTDARETEKVIERMLLDKYEMCLVGIFQAVNCLFDHPEGSMKFVHSRPDWKRAICEAALLAVRGAAQ